MTPQEQALLTNCSIVWLSWRAIPAIAERLIADGLRQAPHAVYALVQTALVQDEALKLANARIEELQAQVGGPEQHRRCTEVLQAAITMRWDAYGQISLGRSMPGNGHLAPPPR